MIAVRINCMIRGTMKYIKNHVNNNKTGSAARKNIRTTIICIMFTVLILPFLLTSEAEAASGDDYLKVGLKYGSNSVGTCTLASQEGFLLGTAEDRSFEEGMPLPAYDKIVVTNENGNIVIRDTDGVTLSADLGSSGVVMPADYDDDGVFYFEGNPYRGGIMFVAKPDGTLSVINYISLEHYVYGVLNAELYHTAPMEALKAQAVAARSFAELNLGKHDEYGFDLCTTTDCQVYKGNSGEFPETNEATDETRGELIYCHGKPVTAFYYKNSGGYTQNAEDVWANSQPYLKSVKDEYCPSYPWSASLSFGEMQDKLEAAGFQPGKVESVSISGRNDSGAVSELKITGSKETVYLKKAEIRNVLGSTLIKSNMFGFTDSKTESGSLAWKISNGLETKDPGKSVYVLGGSGRAQKLDLNLAYGSSRTSTFMLRAASLSETVTGDTVNFSGFGYGHGVGMPQDSAVAMAQQGYSYDEILEYYYTGIEID
ncbi:MAG TPA: SpoIID/LytB domain-containing protein [Anaerovoracaceae bacterium]|nr:SpoIID/LytB domain-containing protein [Anaerovoracaceae bacterium]